LAKKPDLDEPTLQLMERVLRMPPKPHEDMKLGKSRAKKAKKKRAYKKRSS
jgi:hypothetical protein